MEYYESDFYNEPTEFEILIDDLKQSLAKSIKEEFISEMEKLKKENSDLQEVKKNFNVLQFEFKNKLQELEREKQNLKIESKRMRLSELMDDKKSVMHIANWTYLKRPKCDMCNAKRELVYKDPKGNAVKTQCDCDKSTIVYKPGLAVLYEFRLDAYDNELRMFYRKQESSWENKEYFTLDKDSRICNPRVYSKEMNFEKLNKYNVLYM
jgi:hypothetical protein